MSDRSEYVVATLRDLEAFARAEKAALAEIAEQANRPLRLPSNDEVMAVAADLEGCITDDPEVGRATLRRWLTNGVIRVDQSPEGPIAETELLPLMVLIDSSKKVPGKSRVGAVDARKLEILGDGSFSKDLALLSMSSGGVISTLNNRTSGGFGVRIGVGAAFAAYQYGYEAQGVRLRAGCSGIRQ